MIAMRRRQLSFADGLIAYQVSDLRDDLEHADLVLADEAIVSAVYEALAAGHSKSRSRGRHGAPAEVALRQWSGVGQSAIRRAPPRLTAAPLAWRGRCISRGTPERNCRIANTSISERWHGG